jgi:hypothetical protein
MSLNPGTRIRVFTSNWLALYAVKGGQGWQLELIVTPPGVRASVIMRRELSNARVRTMLDALNTVKADYDQELETQAERQLLASMSTVKADYDQDLQADPFLDNEPPF